MTSKYFKPLDYQEKMIVKLSRQQIRGLINEAITSIPFGEAAKYFEEMMTPEGDELDEAFNDDVPIGGKPLSVQKAEREKLQANKPFVSGRLDADDVKAVDDFILEVENKWRAQYDPTDPSMAELGENQWHRQVSDACDKLVDEISNALNRVNASLHDGEFYRG